ncbi:MAG: hypothetical protein AAFS12_00065 [Cyanobacteria bacterium J06632_19]
MSTTKETLTEKLREIWYAIEDLPQSQAQQIALGKIVLLGKDSKQSVSDVDTCIHDLESVRRLLEQLRNEKKEIAISLINQLLGELYRNKTLYELSDSPAIAGISKIQKRLSEQEKLINYRRF